MPGSTIPLAKGHGESEVDGHASCHDGPVVYEQRWNAGRIVMRWVGPGGPEVVYQGTGAGAYRAAAMKGGHWQTIGQRAYDASLEAT